VTRGVNGLISQEDDILTKDSGKIQFTEAQAE
jgi:hypothetical protein